MAETINEYTVMYFFAGDNDLAPVVVSQLKAIKEAGFQEHTDVLVYFDPNEHGVPTKIYHVNQERRRKFKGKKKTQIGDGADPYVHDMEEDDSEEQIKTSRRPSALALRRKLRLIRNEGARGETGAGGKEKDADGKTRQVVATPAEATVKDALTTFLDYCREHHPAKRYILILLGHGMIVGNDTFLPDENPVSSVRLEDFADMLNVFKGNIAKQGTLDLLALHSCSMSAVEVAYQLKGAARYMMASEGPSFVGSWPYRKLLIKTFNTAEKARRNGGVTEKEADELVESLYDLSKASAADYMRAGYSLDLCLCNLAEEKLQSFAGHVRELVRRLKAALKTERGKELILLAHWESQSYWGETYTDLFDFCRCLQKRCAGEELDNLGKACRNVMEELKPHPKAQALEPGQRQSPARFDKLIVHAHNFGSEYQYSHGLSVYFPWSEPVEKVVDGGMVAYRKYAFSKDLGADSWASFLDSYFKETLRDSRMVEAKEDKEPLPTPAEHRLFRGIFRPGPLSHLGMLSRPGKSSPSLDPDEGKSSPSVGGCGCPSIKNYPVDELPDEEKEKRGRATTVFQAKRDRTPFHVTQGLLNVSKKK